MMKILVGITSVILTVALVTGTAAALFSDTATITGITFATGNSDLLVGKNAASLGQTWAVLGSDFQFLNLAPGFNNLANPQPMSLKNNSTAGLNLRVDGYIDNVLSLIPTSAFGVLRDVVYLGVIDTDDALPADITDPRMYTLGEWYDAPREIVNNANALIPNEIENYNVIIMVDPAAGNSIQNKVLSNIRFNLVGTQAL